jgi:hypothetical protein
VSEQFRVSTYVLFGLCSVIVAKGEVFGLVFVLAMLCMAKDKKKMG